MRFAIPQVRSERRSDGATILRRPQALGECEHAVGDWLVRWAERALQRRFLAECAREGWRAITYGEALATCVNYSIDRPGVVGNPAPGIELKLVPAGDSTRWASADPT